MDFIRSHSQGNEPKIGKRVVIIGGGFTAVDAARICIRRGAEEVYIAYRRTREEMPATPEEVLEAEEEGVRVMYLVSPVAFEKENGKITGLRLKSNVLGMETVEGRRKPEAVEGAEFTLSCDTVISAVSQKLDGQPQPWGWS